MLALQAEYAVVTQELTQVKQLFAAVKTGDLRSVQAFSYHPNFFDWRDQAGNGIIDHAKTRVVYNKNPESCDILRFLDKKEQESIIVDRAYQLDQQKNPSTQHMVKNLPTMPARNRPW